MMAPEGLLNIMTIDSEEVSVFKTNSAEVNTQHGGEPSPAKLHRDDTTHDIQARNPSFHPVNCGLAEHPFLH